MSTRLNDKQAAINWDEFRKAIREYTPVALNETSAEKKDRISRLEKDRQAWKEYYFPKYFKYPSPEFHIKASNRLVGNFLRRRHWVEVRHWVRGLAKTTNAMMDGLYLALTGRIKNVIYTSSSYEAAENFLERWRSQLDSNQRIINDYGVQELPGSWRMGNFTTRKGAKFMALGAGQTPRGSGNEEVRPDAIFLDDFDTDEECLNPEIIDKKWRWYERALLFTVDTAEPYLILWMGNIIAEDCCVVRASKYADHTEIINIRDAAGKSVWPEKNTEEDIDYQLSKVSYESGQQEFFNNPMRQGQTFKEVTWGPCPPLSSLDFALVYADPSTSNADKPTAKSKAQNSCKAAVLLGAHHNKFYIYKAYVDHTTNSTFIDWLYLLRDYVGGRTQLYTYIENNTLQNPFYEQVLLPLIHEKAEHWGGMLSITPDEAPKPHKWYRIEGTLEPLVRQGRLVFNQREGKDPHMDRLQAQFLSANPNSRTLDGPDAVQGAIKIIQDKIAAGSNGGVTIIRRKPNPKRF